MKLSWSQFKSFIWSAKIWMRAVSLLVIHMSERWCPTVLGVKFHAPLCNASFLFSLCDLGIEATLPLRMFTPLLHTVQLKLPYFGSSVLFSPSVLVLLLVFCLALVLVYLLSNPYIVGFSYAYLFIYSFFISFTASSHFFLFISVFKIIFRRFLISRWTVVNPVSSRFQVH